MNALTLEKQWNAFIKQGLPTKRDERWKYTDFTFLADKGFSPSRRVETNHLREKINQYRLQQDESILLVFVNGYFISALSEVKRLAEKVIVCDLQTALTEHAELIVGTAKTENPFARINNVMRTDGLFLYVPDKCEIATPIHLLSIATDENFIAHPQYYIILGNHSKLTLVEEHTAFSATTYMNNIVTHIVLGEGAKLTHIKIQDEGTQAVHIASSFVSQKKDSNVELANFSKGSRFARDDVSVTLLERGADCRTSGFYYLKQDNQYIDNHIDITHVAPLSHSEMLYKGILDKKSRAVFNGKLYVTKDAQKILAYQANHNLLLSNMAEVYSKPELEIYADDVRCKHGATTGQLDQEALFYMRARGIEKTTATSILLQGFAEEIIQRVTHSGIKQRVQEGLL